MRPHKRFGGGRGVVITQGLLQPRLLRPAVHARLAQAEPLGGQGARQSSWPAAQRRLEQRAHERVALGVGATEVLERAGSAAARSTTSS